MERIKSFLKCDRGSPGIEFVLGAPILILIFIGIIDLSLYFMNQKRIQVLAANLNDVITKQNISSASLTTVLSLAPTITAPLPFAANGKIVVTSIFRNASGAYVVNWQRSGGGSGAGVSIFPSSGTPTMPSGFSIPVGSSVIFTEVFYPIQTQFLGLIFSNLNLYERVSSRPKSGSMMTLS